MRTNKKLLYFSLNPRSTKAFQDYIARTFQDRRNAFRICSIDEKKPFRHASDLTLFLEEQSNLGYFYVIIDYSSFYNCHLDDYNCHLEDQTDEEKENKNIQIPVPSKIKELKDFTVKEASDIITRTILRFPEVMFLFDESWNEKKDVDFTDFLFYDGCDDISSIYKKYHQYCVKDHQPFAFVERNWDNLYDGSNLRYAIKRYIYGQLCVSRYNFSAVQDSRKEFLSFCIEEEHSQIRFNSYALYTNGFRVLPISSAQDLRDYNLYLEDDKLKGILSPSIVVRDYDLQFADEKTEDKHEEIIDGCKVEINVIDDIRGVKFFDSPDCRLYQGRWHVLKYNDSEEKYDYWSSFLEHPVYFISKGGHGINIAETDIFLEKDRKQLIAKQRKQLVKERKYTKVPLRGILDELRTTGKLNDDRQKQKDVLFDKRRDLKKQIKNIDCNKCSFDRKTVFLDGTTEQIVRGIEKPISGVYLPFHSFSEVKERYQSMGLTKQIIEKDALELAEKCENKEDKRKVKDFILRKYGPFFEDHIPFVWKICRKINTFPLKKKKQNNSIDEHIKNEERSKKQDWVISTERENHDHGVPLDLYDLAKSMLGRATDYYQHKNYIKAAVLAGEIMEVLNGFHEALTLQAYHIQAISENAIAMNVIGGSEMMLKEDTVFRIKKIRNEIDRILSRSNNDNKTEAGQFNTLKALWNRLFNDAKAERRELKYNILNQIFSDCRKVCKDKEYFGAEDCFISAMAYVNEGFTFWDIWYDFQTFCKRVKKSWTRINS